MIEREQNPQVYARTDDCPPTATVVRLQFGRGNFNPRGRQCQETRKHIKSCPYCLGKIRIIQEIKDLIPPETVLNFMQKKEEANREKVLITLRGRECPKMDLSTLVDWVNCNTQADLSPVIIGQHVASCVHCSGLISDIKSATDICNNEPMLILK